MTSNLAVMASPHYFRVNSKSPGLIEAPGNFNPEQLRRLKVCGVSRNIPIRR
jgi:hypothetical protein